MSTTHPDPSDPDATPDLPLPAAEYHAPLTPPPARPSQSPAGVAVHVRREGDPTVLTRRLEPQREAETLQLPTTPRRAGVSPWLGAALAVAVGGTMGWLLSGKLDGFGEAVDTRPAPMESAAPADTVAVEPVRPEVPRTSEAMTDEARGAQGEARGAHGEARGTQDEARGTQDEARGTQDEAPRRRQAAVDERRAAAEVSTAGATPATTTAATAMAASTTAATGGVPSGQGSAPPASRAGQRGSLLGAPLPLAPPLPDGHEDP